MTLRWIPLHNQVRFRRINIQKPKAPHFQKAQLLAVCRPIIPNHLKPLKLDNIYMCEKRIKKSQEKVSNLIDLVRIF